MIRMRLQLQPPGEKLTEVISALRQHISRTQVKPGCLDCRLSRTEQENVQVVYEEDWACWDSLDVHIKSDSFRTILELMEHSIRTPLIQFVEPGTICGIEYVQKARQSRN